MSSTQSGILVAVVDTDNGKPIYDGIGRVFTFGSGGRFTRLDTIPLKPDWNYTAIIMPANWKPNIDVPSLTGEETLEHRGNMSVVCEQWTTGEGEQEKNHRVSRSIGSYHIANTKQGAIELCKFRSLPANPNWYSSKGTISMFPTKDAA